jgi:hypothetical protein
MVIKRITRGLCACAIAGMLIIMGCEKFNGPDPYLCEYKFTKFVALDQAAAPISPEIPLEAVMRIVISDAGIFAIVSNPAAADGSGMDIISIDIAAVGQIVFE